MKRIIYHKLLQWKKHNTRKPLLLKGARQVGKTYVLKEFGEKEFPHFFHFDFMKDKALHDVFKEDLTPARVVQKLEILQDIKIDLTQDLLIFDEIQECPAALTALKYFSEESAHAFVIGSGSFLGLSLSRLAYPVGKIHTLTLYPMTYFEFLDGLGKEKLRDEIIHGTYLNHLETVIHNKAFEYLKYYFITGGLPEVVQIFSDYFGNLAEAFAKVRALQSELLENYLRDMAKHSGKIHAIKIQTVFQNIPLQLARENQSSKKFVFKDVLPHRSNFELLEEPIEWLVQAGLIHKNHICKKALPPLRAYTDENQFNLFIFDVGILGAILDLKPKDIFNYDYGSYKGYFAENFVVQELSARLDCEIYCWKEGTSEVEILIDSNTMGVTPIEVKAGINSKAKSMKVFRERYQPKNAFLISGAPLHLSQKSISYLPLYAVFFLENPDFSKVISTRSF